MVKDMWIGRDTEALVVARLQDHFGDRLDFVSTELPEVSPSWMPKGLWLWRSGGYTSRRSLNALEYAQFMIHAVGRDSSDTAILCSEALAVLSIGSDPLGIGRGLTGPYSNPLPDHPYLARYTVQVEIPVHNRVIDL